MIFSDDDYIYQWQLAKRVVFRGNQWLEMSSLDALSFDTKFKSKL